MNKQVSITGLATRAYTRTRNREQITIRENQSSRRADIQGLRGVAVLLVVAYHAGLPVHGGFIGVDLFFVISGFVITLQIDRWLGHGTFSFREFYARRIRRLFPASALVVFVVLVLAFLFQSPLGPQQVTAKTAVGALLLVGNLAILRTSGGYFDAVATSNPLLHFWSLAVEEQFYLVFPLALVLARRLDSRFKRDGAVSLAVLTTMSLISFAMSLVLAKSHSKLAFYSSPTRAWEFGLGAMLAIFASHFGLRRMRGAVSTLLGLAGAVVLIAANMLINSNTLFPSYAALLPVISATLLISAGSINSNGIVSRLLSTKPATALGDLSYSIYLWHWPTIVFAYMYWPHSWTRSVAAAVSFVPAWLSFRFVENSFRKKSPARARRVFAAAGVVALAMVAFATLIGVTGVKAIPNGSALYAQRNTLTYGRATGCMLDNKVYRSGDIDRCTTHVAGSKGWVMLVGDSHADALSSGVISADRTLHLDTVALTGAGCEFSTQAPNSELVKNCASMNEALLARSTGKDRPAMVIMSHWFVPRVAADKNWPETLRPSMEALRRANIPVLFVMDVPNFGTKGQLQTSSCSGGALNFSCALSVNQINKFQGTARSAELTLAQSVSGVTIFDPWPVFCRGDRCDSRVDGKLAYWDFDHLNGVGSEALSASFAAVMQPIVGAQAGSGK